MWAVCMGAIYKWWFMISCNGSYICNMRWIVKTVQVWRYLHLAACFCQHWNNSKSLMASGWGERLRCYWVCWPCRQIWKSSQKLGGIDFLGKSIMYGHPASSTYAHLAMDQALPANGSLYVEPTVWWTKIIPCYIYRASLFHPHSYAWP